ncbi:MAG: hypothetical protein ACD_55C00092G0004 [uncultured bacterium]|nr:MAG: hypothetical protein ACD_55C00092G0004 [uncultured bacterium]
MNQKLLRRTPNHCGRLRSRTTHAIRINAIKEYRSSGLPSRKASAESSSWTENQAESGLVPTITNHAKGSHDSGEGIGRTR